MTENSYFRIKSIRFVTALDLIKCLKHIKYLRLLLTCAPISELPSNESKPCIVLVTGDIFSYIIFGGSNWPIPHTHSLSLYPSLTHTLSLYPSHTHTLSLSIPHTHTHSLSLSLTHTHTLSLSLTHTHTLSLSLTLTHTLSQSLTHTHSLSLSALLFFDLFISLYGTLSLSIFLFILCSN